jgi:hypothetical protein
VTPPGRDRSGSGRREPSDALFKQGEYGRAKGIYIGLRKTLLGEMQATATRKIVAANRALKLPENDGIDDPPSPK